jgi:hypothetical protein
MDEMAASLLRSSAHAFYCRAELTRDGEITAWADIEMKQCGHSFTFGLWLEPKATSPFSFLLHR